MKFYVNGTLDSQHNETLPICYTTAGPLEMGLYPGAPDSSHPYGGFIDEVRLWNISRTQAEIQSDCYRTLNSTEMANPDLVGYWRFDEGSGVISRDYSIYHDDAALASAPNNPQWVEPGAPLSAFSLEGLVGITGYKLIFSETIDNSVSSPATIDYYWNLSMGRWNGAQWVASGISGSITLVVGYFIPALTTADLPWCVYLLPMSGSNAVVWDDWLMVNFTFHYTYYGINYYDNYTAELNVHPGDIGGAPVTFPYLGADGAANAKDLGIMATYWQQIIPPGNNPTSALAIADIGGYVVVNAKDLGILATDWQNAWTNTPPPD
jgi:hypothetical protein